MVTEHLSSKGTLDYTLSNPNSFKTTENCIGFRWEIEQLEQGESKEVRDKDNDQVKIKTYNIIIDRDFNYIYVYRQEHW